MESKPKNSMVRIAYYDGDISQGRQRAEACIYARTLHVSRRRERKMHFAGALKRIYLRNAWMRFLRS